MMYFHWVKARNDGYGVMLSRQLTGKVHRYNFDYSQPFREEWLLILSRLTVQN